MHPLLKTGLYVGAGTLFVASAFFIGPLAIGPNVVAALKTFIIFKPAALLWEKISGVSSLIVGIGFISAGIITFIQDYCLVRAPYPAQLSPPSANIPQEDLSPRRSGFFHSCTSILKRLCCCKREPASAPPIKHGSLKPPLPTPRTRSAQRKTPSRPPTPSERRTPASTSPSSHSSTRLPTRASVQPIPIPRPQSRTPASASSARRFPGSY